MNIDFPFQFDSRGRTATTGTDDHIRDMIEQFLLTDAGERVNRPDYGSGLLGMVHELNSPELAAALKHTIEAGLNRWLADLIEIRNLEVTSQESTLQILVQYLVRRTGKIEDAKFVRSNAR